MMTWCLAGLIAETPNSSRSRKKHVDPVFGDCSHLKVNCKLIPSIIRFNLVTY
jgi:hypothetical protein